MVAHEGGTWQPDLIGQPDNHPKMDADPATGGVGGAANAPVVLTTNDLSSRTAAIDWCKHRHGGHCWLPLQTAKESQFALYVPQDRGICPWPTPNQQMINCPVSEAGPMAGMERAGMLTGVHGSADGEHLIPVKHAGYKGFVEPYEGHHKEMEEVDHEFRHGDPGRHDDFDEDLYDDTAPEPHTHERNHYDQHGEYPSGYYERHDEAYAKARDQHQQDSAPVGHHANLVNFITNHGANNDLWKSKGKLEDVNLRQPIHATQPYVLQRHVNRYLANPRDSVDHVNKYGKDPVNDAYTGTHHPMFVRHEGNTFAIEGHHRTAAAMIRGDKTIKGAVYDVDKHGWPEKTDEDFDQYEGSSRLHHYARKGRPKVDCDYQYSNPLMAAAHAVRHHDDGICTLTEHKRARNSKKASVADPELNIHMRATWADVRNKAKRLRSEGAVNILVASGDGLAGNVQGDQAVYETMITYVPGSRKIGSWSCGCAWGSYTWGRSPAYKRYEGRACSHVLAMQFEAQSRGMFGKAVDPDTERPSWLRQRTPVQVEPGRTRRAVPPANMRRTFEGHASLATDPDLPSDHGLDLVRPPIYAIAVAILTGGHDPASAMAPMLDVGLSHTAARSLLDEAMADPLVVRSEAAESHLGAVPGPTRTTRCPDCGAEISSHANRCPRCHASLQQGDTGDMHLGAKDDKLAEPTHAGVVLKAADTGRVLMIQRSHHDEDDPAAGTWEFPGGKREEGDQHSLHSGIREFEEEVGQPFPSGGHISHVWQSPNGVYQGHVVTIPNEDAIDFSGGRRTTNPDNPDGDDHEQSAWWHPDDARKNPALRPEVKDSPWDKIKAASLKSITPEAAGPHHNPKARTPYHPYGGWMGPGGWWLWDNDSDEHGTNDNDAGQDVGDMGSEAALHIADYSSHDPLGYENVWPKQRPLHSNSENPGSTGFATSQDPPEWDQSGSLLSNMPLSTWSTLHDDPEPALPSTDGADDDLVPVVDAHSHIPLSGDSTQPGERLRQQMSPEIPDEDNSGTPNQVRASVSDIVARFQATAGAKVLEATGGVESNEIAAAAQAHLAKHGLKDFSLAERQELIGEGASDDVLARNFTDLRIEGTHYEQLAAALATEAGNQDPDELFD